MSVGTISIFNTDYAANFFVDYDLFDGKLFAIDQQIARILVYDLDQKSFLKEIKLSTEGPNAITELRDIDVISSDSIIITETRNIKIINGQGEIIKFYPLHIQEDLISNNIYLGGKIDYCKERNSIIISKINYRSFGREQFHQPLFYEIDIISGKISSLVVSYPDIMQKEDLFYGFDLPQFFVDANSIIYNFPFQSAAYTYDLNTGRSGTYNMESVYTKGLREPLGGRDANDPAYFFSEVVYHPLVNSGNGTLLRLHSKFYKNDQDTPRRSVYLSVWNHGYAKVYEQKLSIKSHFLDFHFVYDGLLFVVKDGTEEKLVFNTISLSELY